MKAIITYISIALLFLGLVGCSEDTIDNSGGEGTLTGTVVENGTNEPLQNVKISTNPLSSTVFTDENGDFIIEDITAGDYSVQASLEGFIVDFEGASITEGNSTNVIFELNTEVANNRPPSSITLLTPEDNATDLETPLVFTWEAIDENEDDELTYTLRLRNSLTNQEIVFDDITEPMFTVDNLALGVQYFWQVSVNDGVNAGDVNSTLRSFTTATQLTGQGGRFLFVRSVDGNNVIISSDGIINGNNDPNELELTSSEVNSWRPRRNDDAGKIAFLRNAGSQTHIFTMDLNGENQQQLTGAIPVAGFNLDVLDYSWDQGGNSIIFPNFNKIYRVNLNGGAAIPIYTTPDNSFVTEVQASENSDVILVKTNNVDGYDARLFTIDSNGNELQTIFEDMPGALGGVDITANATQVLYTYDTSGNELGNTYEQLDARMFVYTFATDTTIDISTNKVPGTNDLDARFSPSEAQVIFVNASEDSNSQGTILTTFIETSSANDRTEIIENGIMPDWE